MKKKPTKEKVAKKKPEVQLPPEPRDLVKYKSRDGQAIRLTFDIVRKFLIQGRPEIVASVTDGEILFFMAQCKAKGLNPFKKDCYPIKYTVRDPLVTIVSIDYLRARANAQADCQGWTGGIIVENAQGAVEKKDGAFMAKSEKLLGGWFKGKKKGWEIEREWTVPLEPYLKRTSDGEVTKFWQGERQQEQIAKVAESQGLRRCWPDELDKLYIKEEIIPQYTSEGSDVDTLPMPAAAMEPEKKKPETKEPSKEIIVSAKKAEKPVAEPPNGTALEQEIRDSIAAIITIDDLKMVASGIDKKLSGIKDRIVLQKLIVEYNTKKQKLYEKRAAQKVIQK